MTSDFETTSSQSTAWAPPRAMSEISRTTSAYSGVSVASKPAGDPAATGIAPSSRKVVSVARDMFYLPLPIERPRGYEDANVIRSTHQTPSLESTFHDMNRLRLGPQYRSACMESTFRGTVAETARNRDCMRNPNLRRAKRTLWANLSIVSFCMTGYPVTQSGTCTIRSKLDEQYRFTVRYSDEEDSIPADIRIGNPWVNAFILREIRQHGTGSLDSSNGDIQGRQSCTIVFDSCLYLRLKTTDYLLLYRHGG